MIEQDIIKSFIIGTSMLNVFHHFLGVIRKEGVRTYSYELYSFVAPLYFGFMNALSLHISRKYNLTLRSRLLYTSIISGIFVFVLNKSLGTYNYNQVGWLTYMVRIIMIHMFTYNILIYGLERQFVSI